MKGVLKIKFLKKYMPIVLTAFVFLFINLNSVNARPLTTQEVEENKDLFISENSIFTIDPLLNKDDILPTRLTETIIIDVNEYNANILKLYYGGTSYDSELYASVYNDEEQFLGRIYKDQTVKYFDVSDYEYIKIVPNKMGFRYSEFDLYNIKLNEYIYHDITNLNYDLDTNNILFNYELPTDENFNHLELYQDGLLLADNINTNNFEVYNLEYDTKYNFTFYAVDKYGNKSNGITREISIPSDPNLIPSNNIFGLTHSVSDTTVSFNYSLPLDNNFSHLKIYRNNELINDNYQLSEYIDIGLDPETEYSYRFVSVNKMDISNVGYAITIKTMEEDDTVPPAVPTGLKTTNMNSGIVLSWNTNTESDLQGYNVYMNGTKMNNKPITNSIYNITNLENGLDYSFTVSAVDTFGNESEQSINVVGVPDVDNLPIFKLDTKLSSIGSSVENWFSEIWLIVAFATAIPLSFAIAGRVKGLFIA